MIIARAVGHGLRAASKRPALVSLLWVFNLTIGVLAAIPAWTWWRGAFAYAPAGDSLLNGFNFATYADLSHYNRASVPGLLAINVAALLAVAGVSSAFAFGGTLETLRSTDSRSFMHRFFRGAGHFFWRFLRLTVYTGLVAVPVIGLVGAVLVPLLKPLDESVWEPGWVLAFAIRFVVLGAALLFFLLVLDFARIRVAAEDTRRAFRTWLASLWLVTRRLASTFGITIVIGLLLLILLAAYFAYCGMAPANTWTWILLLFVVQQAMMWLRAAMRVSHVAAEIALFEHVRPAAALVLPAVGPITAVPESVAGTAGPAAPGLTTVQAGTPDDTAGSADENHRSTQSD